MQVMVTVSRDEDGYLLIAIPPEAIEALAPIAGVKPVRLRERSAAEELAESLTGQDAYDLPQCDPADLAPAAPAARPVRLPSTRAIRVPRVEQTRADAILRALATGPKLLRELVTLMGLQPHEKFALKLDLLNMRRANLIEAHGRTRQTRYQLPAVV